MKIIDLREKINFIDNEIINLLTKRNELSKEIGEIKKINNLPIRDEKREEEMLSWVNEISENKGLNVDYIKKIFQLILQESNRIQNKNEI